MFVVLACGAGGLAQRQDHLEGLERLTLEDLLNMKVTLVSRQGQSQFEAPAAIYVITQEDIRRSGATSIPEVLRMVPGLHVARLSANKWAISSRGFNGQYSDKMLVLIDGRSVYTPLYGGVYWDVQDVLLEDIDRIEVVRGPGAALWGANAVNGVINILTKSALDTQGLLVSAGAGTEERGFGSIRYGGKMGEKAAYRAYFKYFNREGLSDASGNPANDDWEMLRGGFRLDWETSERNSLTLQGDIYDGDVDAFRTELFSPSAEKQAGGNLLTRWKHRWSDGSAMALQFYYDRTERSTFDVWEFRDTIDFDFQHNFARRSHNFVWGLGYRFTTDEFSENTVISLHPNSRGDHLFSGFLQDEITLVEDKLSLTLGSKLEHNDYSGFELQPSGRLLWTPSQLHSVWGSVSRAVRTPSRINHDVRINVANFIFEPGGLEGLISLFGDPAVQSEELLAYELGYRVQPTDRFFVDIAGFYNVYDNLVNYADKEPFFQPGFPPILIFPLYYGNQADAHTYGVEVAANWNVNDRWKLVAGYTGLNMDLRLDPVLSVSDVMNPEGANPRYQFHVRSYLNLPGKLEFDAALYVVDELYRDNEAFSVPGYTRGDIRFGWHPNKTLDLSLVVQNLFDDHRAEFIDSTGSTVGTEVQRGMYGKITLQF